MIIWNHWEVCIKHFKEIVVVLLGKMYSQNMLKGKFFPSLLYLTRYVALKEPITEPKHKSEASIFLTANILQQIWIHVLNLSLSFSFSKKFQSSLMYNKQWVWLRIRKQRITNMLKFGSGFKFQNVLTGKPSGVQL